MNKTLVERIERLIGLCDDPGTEQELTRMLADVRELVDAARVFDFPQDESEADDDISACYFGVAEMRRLSAILRKVDGE